MKLTKTMLVMLMLGSVSILASSCQPGQGTAAATQEQQVTIGRGDISVDITAAGNLALSVKEDLAFDIPGTVEDVLVQEGDSVKKDQVLARLDTSDWDKQMTTLERQATSAERQVTATQKALRDKQNAVVTAQNNFTSKQFALRQAQLDLQSAQDAVTQIGEVKRIQDQIDTLESMLRYTPQSTVSANETRTVIKQYENEMKALLAGTSTVVSSNVALDISKKQLAVEQKQFGIMQAQFDLDNAKLAVDDAQNAIAPAEEDAQNAQDDLVTAQKNLEDARGYGPEVTAPFDGFVIKVNVKGGDDVKKGTVAVQIADPTKFEADVLVNETDIASVRLGGLASIELQAEPGTILSANVTHIAPTATIQQGVVNYKVTVEVGELRPAAQAQLRAGANIGSGNVSPGDFAAMRQAFASGNLTPEQINQMRQQLQQAGGGRFGQGRAFGDAEPTQEQINQMMQQRQQAMEGATGGANLVVPGQVSLPQLTGRIASSAALKLAEGMTVNVSIPVESRTNVIVVPNSAIATRGGQASVKTLNADGTTGERAIQTGISDYLSTEVLGGLNEGETVIITRKTSTGTTSTTGQQSNQIRMPTGGVMFGR